MRHVHAALFQTWSLPFQHIEPDHPAAAELLRLYAFLAPVAIPDALIARGAAHLSEPLQALYASRAKRDEVNRGERRATRFPASGSLRNPPSGW
ncbi:MAG TPA: hypothetical protein VFV38_06630 [Ktedonobacteraceae bacterium]|nr:hypothetical protein [Ktedonobacteraceae bacterium]